MLLKLFLLLLLVKPFVVLSSSLLIRCLFWRRRVRRSKTVILTRRCHAFHVPFYRRRRPVFLFCIFSRWLPWLSTGDVLFIFSQRPSRLVHLSSFSFKAPDHLRHRRTVIVVHIFLLFLPLLPPLLHLQKNLHHHIPYQKIH